MRPSRGMGDIMPSKMGKKRTIVRKDNPNDVDVYKKGGWIQDAVKKPGTLREALGVKKGEIIPAKKLAAAAKKPGKMGKRARLAETFKKLK